MYRVPKKEKRNCPSSGNSADDEIGSVDVPDTPCPLSVSDVEELFTVVESLGHSNEFGIDLYEQTRLFVSCNVGFVL